MKTVVLDDDPTGTQSASGVRVLLAWDAEDIAAALERSDAVYLQTNSRALDEAQTAVLMRRISTEIEAAEAAMGRRIRTVLRGDSTLRGHVFLESDLLGATRMPLLFVPAYPDAGRVTIGGVHSLRIDGALVPVAQTEYARDPVFGYESSDLVDFAREKGGRAAHRVLLEELRSTEGVALEEGIARAGAGEAIVPDVETNEDIELIARAVRAADGRTGFVVRSAAPLAAALAGVTSSGFTKPRARSGSSRVLVACGSHTEGARRQLERLSAGTGTEPVVVDTAAALSDPRAAGERAGGLARETLLRDGLVVVCTERDRLESHHTLAHGELVMEALVRAVEECGDLVTGVVTKGGITAAEVVQLGLNASAARVEGQLATGISIWTLEERGLEVVIVPGNVGDDDALLTAVRSFEG